MNILLAMGVDRRDLRVCLRGFVAAFLLYASEIPQARAEPDPWHAVKVGSWAMMERLESEGDSARVRLVRTVLAGKNPYEICLRSVTGSDSSETTFIALASDDMDLFPLSPSSTVRETLYTTTRKVGRHRYRCVVVRDVTTQHSQCGTDPVDYWTNSKTKWISRHFPWNQGILKSVSGPDSTFFNAWYLHEDRPPVGSAARESSEVVAVETYQRVRGIPITCAILMSNFSQGNEDFRLTEWLSPRVPGGRVMLVVESREPSTRKAKHSEERLVDFHVAR